MTKARLETLRAPARYFRAPKSKGSEPKIDPRGGFRQQGIIRGVSLVTRGEAIGHGFWIDADFLASSAAAVNQRNKGVKARFTHPSLSGDGLGTFLGRAMDAEVSGDNVIADLHFSEAGHDTPDGDLADYVMRLATEDPAAFGVSIVFEPDIGEQDRHYAEHEDEDGYFHSPDKNNSQNLPHARLASLEAADVVDDPAANPNGLFLKEQEFAQEAEQLVSFALGLSATKPATTRLGIDADRTAAFVARFLDQHGLSLMKKEPPKMAETFTKEQFDAGIKEATTKLQADFDVKIAALPKPIEAKLESTDQPSIDAVRAEERTRTKELTALHSNAGLKDATILDRWIDKGVSVLEAKGEIADLAIKQGKLVSSDPDSTDPQPDPNAQYKKEWADPKIKSEYVRMGITNFDDYLYSRQVDDGLRVLVAGDKAKQPAA